MPVISIDGPPIADMEKRRSLVRDLTRAAADAYNLPEDKMIILIRENTGKEVAVGGQLICDR